MYVLKKSDDCLSALSMNCASPYRGVNILYIYSYSVVNFVTSLCMRLNFVLVVYAQGPLAYCIEINHILSYLILSYLISATITHIVLIFVLNANQMMRD